jgi:GT2 family glycosyltransferase
LIIENIVYSPPKITIIILNWNGKEDTIECLKSCKKIDYLNYKIIVVDNGSEDDSAASIKAMFQDIIVIETGKNLGYAGGNNVGIRYALDNKAEYILLLNNDTVVDVNLINAFIEARSTIASPAIMGGKIYYYAQPDTLWYAGARWIPDKLDFEHIGLGQKDTKIFDELTKTDYVTGCLMFVPTEIFRQVGLLDEDFFLIYEETDWCYRARAYGYDCYYIPKAKIWHKVSVSFGGSQSPIFEYFMARNRLLWASKHLGFMSRVKIYGQYLNRIWTRIFPSFILADASIPIVKRYAWSIVSWLKAVKFYFLLSSNRALIRAVVDYSFRRLGNCPESIRTLSRSKLSNQLLT